MAFCRNCGSPYKEGEKYCKSCGSSLLEGFQNKTYNETVEAEVVEDNNKSNAKASSSSAFTINMGKENSDTLVTIARVFIILGMVFGFWIILPLIFGIIALAKLDHPNDKENMIIWGVISIIFVSRIAGILMIVRAFSE